MFSAKSAFSVAQHPIPMEEANQIARAVDQSPQELIQYLDELQTKEVLSRTERTLATILRGILMRLSRE